MPFFFRRHSASALKLTRRWSSGFLQKGFHIAASKALDSPDCVTRQFAPADHPVDGHRCELQQFSELSDGVKFRLGVVSQSRSWHLFPLLLRTSSSTSARYPSGIHRLCQASIMLTIHNLLTLCLSATVIDLLLHNLIGFQDRA